MAKMEAMNAFIKQEIHEGVSVEASVDELQAIFGAGTFVTAGCRSGECRESTLPPLNEWGGL